MDTKLLHKITQSNDKEKMDELGVIFVDVINDLKHSNNEKYKMAMFKMHKLAYGDHLSEEQAHCWVDNMQNKDGTMGEHWSYDQTEQVRKDYGIDANHCDWYAVMNMEWSDYFDEKLGLDEYVKRAKDFIIDKDGKHDKVLRYYTFIVC